MPTRTQIIGKLKYYCAPLSKQLKYTWQSKGQLQEPELIVPKKLKGVPIFDPFKRSASNSKQFVPQRPHPVLDQFFPQPEKPKPEQLKSAFIIDDRSRLWLFKFC
ncbi:hypothetical protein ACOME3_004798 [Neoechinorhynchus agilis]